jgi:hypothetical protein
MMGLKMSLQKKVCLEKKRGVEIKEASISWPRVARVLKGISESVFVVFQMRPGNRRKVEFREPVPVGFLVFQRHIAGNE